ncbi:DUF29 domain-containing protein [Pannus brasiliensis CCIBt3594]|uniref:DUF29 domain-containing protein n=1 Tax=Pannus brasiliensis CCIBt3594 TaxID=1427578 RepID=A0AAW9QUA1_9CHRO
MTERIALSTKSLYDRDFVLWTEKTSEQLRRKAFADLDLENLIEEVESTGRSERQAVESLLTVLIEYLLKLTYWTSERERNARHWLVEIANFRVQLEKRMKTTPLENHARDSFDPAYSDARKSIILARIVDKNSIPEEPFFALEQVLDGNWFPVSIDRFLENRD